MTYLLQARSEPAHHAGPAQIPALALSPAVTQIDLGGNGRLAYDGAVAGRDVVAVASMNLHCGIDTRGRRFDIAAAVRGLAAPVIAVQETWSPADRADDAITAAARDLGARVFRATLTSGTTLRRIGIPAESGLGDMGTAVLTTLPVTDYEVIDLGLAPGDIARRCAQVLTLGLPDGGAFRLAGVHLTYRGASPLQLALLIRQLGRKRLPTVIAGDLNMPRQLARLAPGFAPTVRGRTWPAELPLMQLDHVLAGSGVRRLHGTVLPPAGSDHLPVRALLTISG
jgi:endonuclease/exonuclease/phosphatase family metal-dependent hydrolase